MEIKLIVLGANLKPIEISACRLLGKANADDAPAIYVIDMPEHPLPIEEAAKAIAAHVVSVPVANWNNSLTPWQAPGLYKGEADFGGEADVTLTQLVEEVIPAIEKRYGLAPQRRAISGYSLGGLFSLYAFLNTDRFAACGALSPSVWYPSWLDYISEKESDLKNRFAYFSIGSKEKRGIASNFRCVEDNLRATAEQFAKAGCETEVNITPGNHMQHIPERLEAGLTALDKWLDTKGRTQAVLHFDNIEMHVGKDV